MFPTLLFALSLEALPKQIPPPKPIPRIGIPKGEIPRDISSSPKVAEDKTLCFPPPTTLSEKK